MRFMSSSPRSRRWLPFAGVVSAQTTNRPPTISGSPPAVIKVNTRYNFKPIARDPEGRTLKFTIANKPGWMAVAITPSSGRLIGYPKSAGGCRNIVLRVSDGVNIVSLPAFPVTANSTGTTANRAPTISGTPATTAKVGTAYSFQPSASDPDGNTLGLHDRESSELGELQHDHGSPDRHADGDRHVLEHRDRRERRTCDHFAAGVLDQASASTLESRAGHQRHAGSLGQRGQRL